MAEHGIMTEKASTEKQVSPEHYIFDSVMAVDELLWIYHELLNTSSWTLTRSSGSAKNAGLPFTSFPGLDIETFGVVHIEFLSGYFRSVVFRIRALAKKNNNAILPPNIQRIHVGAKSSFSKTEFHVDSNEEKVWTILGFLNPVWNVGDGGEFFLKDHKIQYKAGRFVVFPSNTLHDGGYVKNEKLNYWRVAVNIILDNVERAPGQSVAAS
jgi:2OG-Fe(II) oxygenase superfamily